MQKLLQEHPAGVRLNTAEELRLRLADRSRLRIVVGHSEDRGRQLVLPDGRRIEVERLHEDCRRAGSECVVVTCFSRDLHLATTITSDEARDMVRVASVLVQAMPSLNTPGQLTILMRQTLLARRTSRIAVTAGTTATGGAVVMWRPVSKRYFPQDED